MRRVAWSHHFLISDNNSSKSNTEEKEKSTKVVHHLDFYERIDCRIERDRSVVAVEVERDELKSQVGLGLADVTQRRVPVHDETEVETHRDVLVADVRHRCALLTTKSPWSTAGPRPRPAACPYPVPETVEQLPATVAVVRVTATPRPAGRCDDDVVNVVDERRVHLPQFVRQVDRWHHAYHFRFVQFRTFLPHDNLHSFGLQLTFNVHEMLCVLHFADHVCGQGTAIGRVCPFVSILAFEPSVI